MKNESKHFVEDEGEIIPKAKIIDGRPTTLQEGWWICSNDLCNERLARIIRDTYFHKDTEKAPVLVEILGAHGEQFMVQPRYIRLYCKACGESNSYRGGKFFSKEWYRNFKLELKEESFLAKHDLDEDEFFINPYKRNLLLKKLTKLQREIFKFMQADPLGLWNEDYTPLMDKFGLTNEEASKEVTRISVAQIETSREEGLKKLAKFMEEEEKFKKWLTLKKKNVHE